MPINSLKKLLSNQKGAMFGLDARLAMIIFAALAIVAGYMGYGRIETAHEARLIRELQAMDDAFKQYQVDMGTFFLFTLKDSSGDKDIAALWDKSLVKRGFQPKWNGPYITDESLTHKNYGKWGLQYGQETRVDYCTLYSKCFLWIRLTNVPAKIWETINSIIDEGAGASPELIGTKIKDGKIQADNKTDPRQLFYRSIERNAK